MPIAPSIPSSIPSMTAPTADAPGALDLIFIEGYLGQTVIGIHPSEFHATQPLVIDVHAGVPHAMACDSDHITDTIDYGVVRDRLDALMLDHGVTLLEALAERIAQMLLIDFGAVWVRVKVVKPRKFDNVQAVGVQIERRRTATSATARQTSTSAAQVLRWIGAGTVPQAR
jgi:dihydroneopterin aldolase